LNAFAKRSIIALFYWAFHIVSLVWPVPLAQYYHVLNWFFIPKPGFLKFIWIFRRNHLKVNISHILNPNLTKWIPLNTAHQDLSNNTKDTFHFLQKFQLWFNLIFSEKTFNIQELLHYKSKHPGTRPMHPSSSRAFQRHQEHYLKHPSLVDLISTNQNKLPSFIDKM
jgi:hypothetical protein